ncbi:MAG: rRNA maturation RNase YbeY [Patescibacteria group bacterium]
MRRGVKEQILARKMERLAAKIINIAPPAGKKPRKTGKIDVFLLGDAEMKRIKKRFLPREKGPANVLSFGEPAGWPRPERGAPKLGEIYLNLDLTGGGTGELAALLVHGVLHLLGYDHRKKSDRMKMENLEKKILLKLGV